ncbi:MAG TPA: hypothetical protein VKR29_06845 [Candidatus Binataceae bacterium]|nr:hypothetical protein [Candidatus Binataceae bacterium]
MTIRIALVSLLALLACGSVARAADRMRLVSVPLDMPLSSEEALDNQALEGLYQGDYGTHMKMNVGGYIPRNLKSSGQTDAPFKFITSELKDRRTLQLWFSSADDGNKTFGVSVETPYIEKPSRDVSDAIAELQSWGKPDLAFAPPEVPAQQIEVFVDHTVAQERLDAVLARLPKADKMSADDRNKFSDSDLRDFVRILGPQFRGGIAIVNQQNGKLTQERLMLLDLIRAGTVFNLEEAKPQH